MQPRVSDRATVLPDAAKAMNILHQTAYSAGVPTPAAALALTEAGARGPR